MKHSRWLGSQHIQIIIPCFTAHTKVSIVAVKFIPYFTGSSEKVVIAISLARIYVNNVAPISVLVHSDKLRI